MKKILAFLTLCSFLIASQIPLVHAFDMQNMQMQMDHTDMSNMSVQVSIFCESRDPETGKTECSQDIIKDKGIFSTNNKEIKIRSLDFYLAAAEFAVPPLQENLSDPVFFRKYRYKSKSSYTELIWVSVKNLN